MRGSTTIYCRRATAIRPGVKIDSPVRANRRVEGKIQFDDTIKKKAFCFLFFSRNSA